METDRRLRRIAFAVLFATAALISAPSRADDYPSQDLHFITSFPPGSGADVLTRFFAEKVRALTGRTVIVENKSGASGAIAVQYTAQAKPDGYTMYLSAGSATAAQMHLFKVPPVNVLKAFQLAATINRQAFMLTVDAKTPYTNVPALTAAMKQKGKAATYATAATSGIIMGEMYKSITGVEAVWRAAAWTTACMIRCFRSRSNAKADCASWRTAPASDCPPFPTSRPWRNPVCPAWI
jgi:tripartite-type tricarboxylate transporter receptor subunit TctC